MINNYKTKNGYIKRNAPLMLKVSQPFVGKGFASHWNQVSRETFPIGRLTNNSLLLAFGRDERVFVFSRNCRLFSVKYFSRWKNCRNGNDWLRRDSRFIDNFEFSTKDFLDADFDSRQRIAD